MIYLAGSCSGEQRELLNNVAAVLRDSGNDVYCPFELKIENAWDYSQEEWSKLVFDKDKSMIDNCDIFLMISPGRISTAGTNWEQGYAFAINKKVIVVQFTEEKTSLMTFCGCSAFINTNTTNIYEDVLKVINSDMNDSRTCSTILT